MIASGAFWDERYKGEEFLFGEKANQYLTRAAPKYLKQGDRALCDCVSLTVKEEIVCGLQNKAYRLKLLIHR
jgi:hypothetical protein